MLEMASADRRKPLRGRAAKNAASAKAIRAGDIDYKDVATLRKFISERGNIRARRITGNCRQEQRLIVAIAVKNSRAMACCPTPALLDKEAAMSKVILTAEVPGLGSRR